MVLGYNEYILAFSISTFCKYGPRPAPKPSSIFGRFFHAASEDSKGAPAPTKDCNHCNARHCIAIHCQSRAPPSSSSNACRSAYRGPTPTHHSRSPHKIAQTPNPQPNRFQLIARPAAHRRDGFHPIARPAALTTAVSAGLMLAGCVTSAMFPRASPSESEIRLWLAAPVCVGPAVLAAWHWVRAPPRPCPPLPADEPIIREGARALLLSRPAGADSRRSDPPAALRLSQEPTLRLTVPAACVSPSPPSPSSPPPPGGGGA
jgi:hypothetical protein